VSAPRVAITPERAIMHLAFVLGWPGDGELPVWVDGRPNPAHRLPCDAILQSGKRLARIAANLDMEQSAEVAVGLPRMAEFVYSSAVLWANVETKDSAWRASQFRPQPDIVLKMGASARRLLLWVLKNPITAEATEDANRRIAYALHGLQKFAKPETLRINLPGTFLRVGRSQPVPVLVTRLAESSHTDRAIVGRLKSPPAPWSERMRGRA
jgi:hypothetical protein